MEVHPLGKSRVALTKIVVLLCLDFGTLCSPGHRRLDALNIIESDCSGLFLGARSTWRQTFYSTGPVRKLTCLLADSLLLLLSFLGKPSSPGYAPQGDSTGRNTRSDSEHFSRL